MALKERDEFSGQLTTGHEWNGIKELNTPVPKLLWGFLITMALFGVIWTVLMPSWPGINGYFRGLLGADQHMSIRETMAEANAQRAIWTERLATEDLATLQADEAIMSVVRTAAPAIFVDNCAACHGPAGKGNQELGAPNLTDAISLYGMDMASLTETISNSRNGVMPAWQQRLDATTIKALTVYVHSLGGGQ